MPELSPEQKTSKTVLNKYVKLAGSAPGPLTDDQILTAIPELKTYLGSNYSVGISALRNFDQQLQNTPDEKVGELTQSFISSFGKSFVPPKTETSQPSGTTTTEEKPSSTPSYGKQILNIYSKKAGASPQPLSDDEIKKDLIANGIVTNHDEIIGQLRSFDQQLQNTPDDQIPSLISNYSSLLDESLKKKESTTQQITTTPLGGNQFQAPTSDTLQATSLLPSETGKPESQSALGGSTLGSVDTVLESQGQLPETTQPTTGAQPLGPYKAGLGVSTPPSRQSGFDLAPKLKEFRPLDSYVNDFLPKSQYNVVDNAGTENLMLDINTGMPLGASQGMSDFIQLQRSGQKVKTEELTQEFNQQNEENLKNRLSVMYGLPPEVIEQKKGEWALQSKISGNNEGLSRQDIEVRDRLANEEIRRKGDVLRDEYYTELKNKVGENQASEYWNKKSEEIGKSYLTENDLNIFNLKNRITELESTENRTVEQEIELKKLRSSLDTAIDLKLTGNDLFNKDGQFVLNKKIQIENKEEFTDAVNKYAAIYDGTDKSLLTKERDNAFFQYVSAKRKYDEAKSFYDKAENEYTFDNESFRNNPKYKGYVFNTEAENINNLEAYMEDRLAYFMGVNRALLLNEDPGTGAEDTLGTGIIEGLKEGLGIESQSVSALRDHAITGIQNAGFEITDAQQEKISQDFWESAGRSIGNTLPLMAEIGAELFLMNKVAGALKIPKLIESLSAGSKFKKFMYNAVYDTVTQSVAFAGAGESAFAGAGEGVGQAIGEALIGKWGVANRLLNFGARWTAGSTTETLAEFTGQFFDELERNGWDMQKASEETFGKTADEFQEKLALTFVVAGILGIPGAAMGRNNEGSSQMNTFSKVASDELQKSDSDSPIVKFAKENDYTKPPTKEEVEQKEEVIRKKEAGEEITEEELVQSQLTATKEEFQKNEQVEKTEASPIISKTGGDTEYTFEEGGKSGFVSEKEVLTKLDDENFINRVKNGEVVLNVTNPSPEIESKIKEKFPEKSPELKTKTAEELIPESTSFKDIKKEDIIPVGIAFKNEPTDDYDMTIAERREMVENNRDKMSEQPVSVDEIIPTQNFLDDTKTASLEGDSKPVLFKTDKGIFVLDGHHRIASQINQGQKVIDAVVIDFTEKQKKEGYDKENITGVSGKEQVRQKPVGAEPIKTTGTKTVTTGGNVQTQEKVKPVKRTEINGKKLPMAVEHNWSSGKDVKVTTPEEAIAFADENVDSIIDNYLTNNEKGKSGIIDPDAVREYFAETGYDGKNVPTFVAASNKLTEAIFQKILKDSKNKKITFLSGVGGSGKTRATKGKIDTKGREVYDSAFNYFEDLDQKVQQAKDAGFEVEVAPVYNDAKTAFKNTLKRGKEGGRFLSLAYFISSFRQNRNKLQKLADKHKDITISPIDNSGNESKKVSLDESLEWDYRITDEQLVELLKEIENDTKLTADQVASIGQGIRGIREFTSEWTSEMERLVTGIEKRIEQAPGQKSRSTNVEPTKPTRQYGGEERLKTKTDETKTKAETTPKTGVLEPEKVSEEESKQKKIKESSKKLAEKIRSGKINISGLDKLSSSPKPIFDAAWNTALEAMALTIEAGGSVTQAIADGMRVIQNSEWFKSLSDENKEKAQDMIAQGLTDQLSEEEKIEKPAPEEKPEKKEGKKNEQHRQSKVAYRHAKTLEGEKKKEVLDKTKYQVFNPEEGAKQIDSLYEELGTWEAAVDYVNDPKNKVHPALRQGLLVDASAKMIEEGEKTANNEMVVNGNRILNEVTFEATAKGQANAFLAEIYKRNPGIYWRKKIFETAGQTKQKVLEQDYGGESLASAIDNVRKEFESEVSSLKEEIKKVTEQLREEMSKSSRSDINEKIESRKKKAEARITNGFGKIRQAIKGKGGTANAGIDPLLLEGIIDVITGYIEKGTLSTAKIVSRVYYSIKEIGGNISKENIANIARSLNEFNSLERTEQVKEFYDKIKKQLNQEREVSASTIDEMVTNPETIWEQYQQNILSKIRSKISQLGEGDTKEKAELEKLSNKIAKEINAKISEISAGSKKRTGEKASSKETIIDLMSNSDKIKELYNTILSNKDVSVDVKNAIMSLVDSEVVFSTSLVENLINEEAKSQGRKIDDIVASHYTGKKQFVGDLSETLVREAGLSVDEANLLAKSIEEKMMGIIEEKAEKLLIKFLAKKIDSKTIQEAIESGKITPEIQKEIDKRLKTSENKNLIKKVSKAINLGALNSPEFVNAFGEKFGFVDIPIETQARIYDLISEIERLRSPQQTTKEVDGKVINTFQRERVFALEKELNTLIDTISEKNFAWFAENYVAYKYLSALSGVGTQINAATGTISGLTTHGLAFGARNILSLRGLLLGMVNGFNAFKASRSRSKLARRMKIVEVGATSGGYMESSSEELSGATEEKMRAVERQMLFGFKKALSNLKEGKIAKGVLNFLSASFLQPLRLYYGLSASDAFFSSSVSAMIETVQEYNKIAKELNLNPLETFTGIMSVKKSGMSNMSLVDRVQLSLNQDKQSKDAFRNIAKEEFSQIRIKIAEKLINKGYSGRELEKAVQKELKKQIGGAGWFSSIESMYVSRRVKELQENQNIERFNYAVGMVKDALMIGRPDGLIGLMSNAMTGVTKIKKEDPIIKTLMKTIGSVVFMFPRLSANSFNHIKTAVPFVGLLDAFLGFGLDPKTGKIKTGDSIEDVIKNFFISKYKLDKERVWQRVMINTITTTAALALMRSMFEWDDDEDDLVLREDRWLDVLGPGNFSMKKNIMQIEDFKKFSFSTERNENGIFENYMKTNLSPQFQALVSLLSAFSDDERGLGDKAAILERKGDPVSKFYKGLIQNPFQSWFEGSFNSIGRYVGSAQYEETALDAFNAIMTQILLDNTKSIIQPAAYRDITQTVYKNAGEQQKKIESFPDKFLSGLYGLDFVLEEKTDMFGNTYPTTDNYDKWIGGVEKMSEKHPEVALLYKFEGGLNISKWKPSNMDKHETFNVGPMKFESKSDDVADRIVNRQEEIFKQLVSENIKMLESIDTKDELDRMMNMYQGISKKQAELELFEELINDGSIVMVIN